MGLQLQHICQVKVFLIALQFLKCDGLSCVLKRQSRSIMSCSLEKPFYVLSHWIFKQSSLWAAVFFFFSKEDLTGLKSKAVSSRVGTQAFWFQVLCSAFCALLTVSVLSSMVATGHICSQLNLLILITLASQLLGHSSFVSSARQPVMANSWHIGPCRYKVFPSSQKFFGRVGL